MLLTFKIIVTLTLLVSNQLLTSSSVTLDFRGTASTCRAEAARIEAQYRSQGNYQARAVCTGSNKQSSDALYQP